MEPSQIILTTANDLEFIYSMFEEAIAYQKKNNYPVWNGFDKDVLIKDIEQQQQYKIISGNEILCIFSVVKSDPVIWREKEKGDALYLHRVVANQMYKGQKHFEKIRDWAIDFGKQQQLKYIRMDTWAHNPKIIDYYKNLGFRFVENYHTPNSTELALQQRNLSMVLLEYPLY